MPAGSAATVPTSFDEDIMNGEAKRELMIYKYDYPHVCQILLECGCH